MKIIVAYSTVIALLLSAGVVLAENKKGAQAPEPPEKKLKQAEVPKAVLDAVTKKYPDGKLKDFGQETEEGKPLFEVELVSPSKGTVSIDVSPEGKILAEETLIKTSAIPPPVKAGLTASKYKTWKVVKAERVIEQEKDDSPAYELLVQSKKKKFELVFDKDGKITKEEEKSLEDND